MNKLTRILFSIFLSNRSITSDKIKDVLKDEYQKEKYTPNIEVPPPQDEQDPFKIHKPNEDYDPNDIDLTGAYDPLKETNVIFEPLQDDIKFFNIYKCMCQDDFLLNRSEFNIKNVTENSAKFSGAGSEFKILFNYLKDDPKNYRLRLYKVQSYLVLGASLLDNHTNDWYYCTLLELPEGRFNPIILTIKKSPKAAIKQNLEHWADHSRSLDGGNK
jgi:hypothetical protein